MQSLSTLTNCTLYAGIIQLVRTPFIIQSEPPLDRLPQLTPVWVISISQLLVIISISLLSVFLTYLSCKLNTGKMPN